MAATVSERTKREPTALGPLALGGAAWILLPVTMPSLLDALRGPAGRSRRRGLGALLVVVAVAGCRIDPDDGAPSAPDAGADDAASCGMLFGAPNEHTGLDASQCQPRCACGGTAFEPPVYGDAFVRSLVDDWEVATPYATVDVDPYLSPAPAADPPETVCAVLPTAGPSALPRAYALATYASESAARAAGAAPTHFGHCGVCSTLADLAVYMREADLTGPVRACGLSSKDAASNVACLQALGFDLPCAQVWYWNTAHTRSVCLAPCLAELNAPYQLSDGGLNACIQCDETESGPTFKAVAGRTRRNSGLPNALCRPCSEVRPLVHDYRAP